MKSLYIHVLLGITLCIGIAQAKETKLDPEYGEPSQFEKKEKAKPQKLPNGKIKLKYGPLHFGKRQDPAMKKWRDNLKSKKQPNKILNYSRVGIFDA